MLSSISNSHSSQLYTRPRPVNLLLLPPLPSRPRPTRKPEPSSVTFIFRPNFLEATTISISKKLCPFLGQGQRLVLGHQRPPRPSKTSCLLWPKRRGPQTSQRASEKTFNLSNGLVLGFVMRCQLTSLAYHSLSTRWNRTITSTREIGLRASSCIFQFFFVIIVKYQLE